MSDETRSPAPDETAEAQTELPIPEPSEPVPPRAEEEMAEEVETAREEAPTEEEHGPAHPHALASSDVEVVEEVRFADLDLLPEVLRAVEDAGYERPTAIQAEAIPVVLQGRDVLGSAQTGTGKTAAFSLPTLSLLKAHSGKTRCLVLEPTRELAAQVYESFEKYGKHLDLKLALLHGGVGYGKQREQLQAGADIVIATPGRLLDHLQQRAVNFSELEVLILDEVDRMLDMGFLPDVRRIVEKCPSERQTLFFSATIPPELVRLAEWAVKNPVRVAIDINVSTAETVTHLMLPVDHRQKDALVDALLSDMGEKSVIIFTRTKMGADTVAAFLHRKGHKITTIHSDRNQKEREQALAGFKEGEFDILVATDIVARGIDIRNVTHVINYDIPENPEDYVHRIGRTGRAASEGDAYTLLVAGEEDRLRDIERLIGAEIPRVKLKGFDYTWSPILEMKRARPKKRNRGYLGNPAERFKKKRR